MGLSKLSEKYGKGVINLALVCPRYLVEGKMSVLGRACPSYIVRGKILDAPSVFVFLCSSK